ncbi:MAG: 50S ribosomal protein L14e [Candidatus Altiarchaeota archaeon]
MALLDVGRVCRKTRGRDAGQYCVIVGKEKGGFTVECADARKSKASGAHLEPTPWTVSEKAVGKGLADLKLA